MPQRNPSSGKFNYRPLTLKLYGLLSVLFITLALIGLLELANRTLPKGSGKPQPQRKQGLRVRHDRDSVVRRMVGVEPILGATTTSLPILARALANPSACPSPSPVQCQKCLCDPGSELFESCDCPADPHGVGCQLVPREPDCDVDNPGDECPCASINEWRCGVQAMASMATACSTTLTTLTTVHTTSTTVLTTSTSSTTVVPTPTSSVCPSTPQVQCQKCLCDPGSELFESCGCPVDPLGAGCELIPREPDCDVDNPGDECPCVSINEWRCGPQAMMSASAACTTTLPMSTTVVTTPNTTPTTSTTTTQTPTSSACPRLPPVQCQKCLCNPGSELFEPCDCPADPRGAGCELVPREPDCDVDNPGDECPCTFIDEWRCGVQAVASMAMACTTTVLTVVTTPTLVATTSTTSTTATPTPTPSSGCPSPPPVQCQKCLCNSGSELFEPCDCPADPPGVGCTLIPRELDCDVDNPGDECPCTSIREWRCGVQAVASMAMACSSTPNTTPTAVITTPAVVTQTLTPTPTPSTGCPSPPPVQCQKCLCNSGSELFEPCNCPVDPQGMGCSLVPREPDCDVDSPGDECPCTSINEWRCGVQAVASITAACSTTPSTTASTAVATSTTVTTSSTLVAQIHTPTSGCPSPAQVQCQKCLCDSGSELFEPCDCPPDPRGVGCELIPREPDCDVDSPGDECPCTSINEWRCGIQSVASIAAECSATVNTTSTAVVTTPTIATQAPTPTPTSTPTPTTGCPSPPQIPCQKCLCNSGSELFEPCNCPTDPHEVGCELIPREPDCDVDNPGDECPCTSINEWRCGVQAVAGIAAACSATPNTTTSATVLTPSVTGTPTSTPTSGCPSPPQVPCQKCLCNQGTELFEQCNCPSDPQGLECIPGTREPDCDVDNPGDECPCTSISEWRCDLQAVLGISAACSAAPDSTTIVNTPTPIPSNSVPTTTTPIVITTLSSTTPIQATTDISSTGDSTLVPSLPIQNPVPTAPPSQNPIPTITPSTFPPEGMPPTTTPTPTPESQDTTATPVLAISTSASGSPSLPPTETSTDILTTIIQLPSVSDTPTLVDKPQSALSSSSLSTPPPSSSTPPLSTAAPTPPLPIVLTIVSTPPPAGSGNPVPVTFTITGLPPVVVPAVTLSTTALPSLVLVSSTPTAPTSPSSSSAPPPLLSLALLPSSSTAAPPNPQTPLTTPPSGSLPAPAPPLSGSTFILTTDSQGKPTGIPATIPASSSNSSSQPLPTAPAPDGIFVISPSQPTQGPPLTLATQSSSNSVLVATGPKVDLPIVPTALLATDPSGVPTGTFPAPTGTDNVGGGDGGDGGPDEPGSESIAIPTWPIAKTFLGGYMPIIIARLYQMGWTALHTQINEFTPFSQLASHDGAPASVLFSNGLSTWYSWLGFAAVWVMTPLSSEIIYLDTDYCQNPNLKSPNNPCWPPRISVRPGIILILQVLLGIAAVTVAIAGIAWFHKPSGCSGDPTSIAAVAAIMGHPDVEWDFEGLGADITMEELKELLKDRKYKLGHYRLANGTERYGITPASQGDGAELAPRGNLNTSIPQRRWGFSFLRGWKNSALLIDGLFFCFLLGILGAITAYVKAVNNSSLAKVFEARTIGRRLLFALLGSLTASNWGRLGRESQTLSPYMRLSQPNAGPTSTILLKRRTLPFTAFFTMLRNQHFTAATIAFTSLLSELLVVTLSGIPYRPGQLRQEFLLCGIATFAILALMLAVLALASTWRRFFLPHLPRKPDSVAAVMTYVSGSSMNADFEGLEGLPVAQRDGQIKKFGKRYGYGLVRRGDGGVRWAVDEVQGTGEAARKFSSESSTSSTRAT